jgi:hypothetical protein
MEANFYEPALAAFQEPDLAIAIAIVSAFEIEIEIGIEFGIDFGFGFGFGLSPSSSSWLSDKKGPCIQLPIAWNMVWTPRRDSL